MLPLRPSATLGSEFGAKVGASRRLPALEARNKTGGPS